MVMVVMVVLQHVQIGQVGLEVAVGAVGGDHHGLGSVQVQVGRLWWVGQVAAGLLWLLWLLVALVFGEGAAANQHVIGFGWKKMSIRYPSFLDFSFCTVKVGKIFIFLFLSSSS